MKNEERKAKETEERNVESEIKCSTQTSKYGKTEMQKGMEDGEQQKEISRKSMPDESNRKISKEK